MGGTLVEDRQLGDNQLGGIQGLGILEKVVGQVDNHRVVHTLVVADMQVVVHTQQKEELADQCVTSAEQGALPLVGVQISHHACPFQSCAESANKISSSDNFHAYHIVINHVRYN